MSIEKFLDLSTGYMTAKDCTRLRDMATETLVAKKRRTSIYSSPRVISHEYGMFVNVQQDGDVFVDHIAALVDAGFSGAFIKVITYARKQGCWWINFDQDGPKDLKGFRIFSW